MGGWVQGLPFGTHCAVCTQLFVGPRESWDLGCGWMWLFTCLILSWNPPWRLQNKHKGNQRICQMSLASSLILGLSRHGHCAIDVVSLHQEAASPPTVQESKYLRVPSHSSKKGSFFLENLKKPGENDWFLKRMGNQPPENRPAPSASLAFVLEVCLDGTCCWGCLEGRPCPKMRFPYFETHIQIRMLNPTHSVFPTKDLQQVTR